MKLKIISIVLLVLMIAVFTNSSKLKEESKAEVQKSQIDLNILIESNKKPTIFEDFCLYQVIIRPERYYTYFYNQRQGFKFFSEDLLVESGGLYHNSSIQLLSFTNGFKTLKKVPIHPRQYSQQVFSVKVLFLTQTQKTKQKYFSQLGKKDKCKILKKDWFMIKTQMKLKDLRFLVKQKKDGAQIKGQMLKELLNSMYQTDLRIFTLQIRKPGKLQEQLGYQILIRLHLTMECLKTESMKCNSQKINFMQTYIQRIKSQGQTHKMGLQISFFFIKRVYDLSPIVEFTESSEIFRQHNYGMGECLNGIAYRLGHNYVYLTGKQWPYIFKVQFKENPKAECKPP